MNNEQQHFSNLEEILSKIPNGKERYRTSPLVAYMVDSLLYGADPIALLGSLINMLEGFSRMNHDLALKQPLQPMTLSFDPESDFQREWLQKVINLSSTIAKPESTGGPIIVQDVV